jgi:hypothetical protein
MKQHGFEKFWGENYYFWLHVLVFV